MRRVDRKSALPPTMYAFVLFPYHVRQQQACNDVKIMYTKYDCMGWLYMLTRVLKWPLTG
jgi:hypothetical protein